MKMRSMTMLALLCVALAPTAAQSADQRAPGDQQACMNDAMTICSQFIPDRERVASCLISNRRRVSIGCRAQLAHWHG